MAATAAYSIQFRLRKG